MKLSCIPVCFARAILRDKTMSREDWIETALEVGLNGTEIFDSFFGDMNAAGIEKFRDAVYDAGLHISM